MTSLRWDNLSNPMWSGTNGGAQEPGPWKATRREGAVTDVIAEKGIAWAARQGTNDRNAGTACRKYKNFLSIYKLPRSPFTLRMWNVYLLARRATSKKAVRAGDRRKRLIQADPPRKSIPAVVGPRMGCAPRGCGQDRRESLPELRDFPPHLRATQIRCLSSCVEYLP